MSDALLNNLSEATEVGGALKYHHANSVCNVYYYCYYYLVT